MWPATSASTRAANVAGTWERTQSTAEMLFLHLTCAPTAGQRMPRAWLCVRGARRVPPLPGDLLNHVRALTESCQPAAGSTATLVPELRLRRVRKWVQSHIRAHGRCSMDALLQVLLHRVQAADANCARAVLAKPPEPCVLKASPSIKRGTCAPSLAEKTVHCIAVGHAFLHSPRPARTVFSPPSAAIWLTTTSN